MKKNKAENMAVILLLLIGFVFVMSSGLIFFTGINKENRIETTAVITEINRRRTSDDDTSYDVFVKYEVDGNEYNNRINVYSSSFYEGKEIKIFYDKTNPNKIEASSTNIIALIFPAVGIILIVIAIAIKGKSINKNKKNKQLKESGQLIYATYSQTILNTSYSVNGRNPYNVICEWNNPADNKKYIFKSENIWINPQQIIQDKNITNIPVYINPSNIKQYMVDVSIFTEDVVDLT